jgi:hypothetical protein
MLLDELLGVAVPAALGAIVVSVALNCEKGVGTLFGRATWKSERRW